MIPRNLVLIGGDIVAPDRLIEDGVVELEDGVITGVSDRMSRHINSSLNRINCQDKIIMPGFVDVHTHGGVGLDFADEDPDTARQLSRYYYRHGTTTLLATLHSLPMKLLIPALKRLAAFCRESDGSSNVIGIHTEGPFLNRAQRGANSESYIENPDLDSWENILRAGAGNIRVVTIAPELPDVAPVIKSAIEEKIVVSLGHSSANEKSASEAIEMGATQVTHLFNAMPQLHHRKPGILTEALLSDKIDTQLIADGIHVHPQVLKLVSRLKGPDHIMLITDSIRAAQLGDGEYTVAGNQVRVENGISKLRDNTIAGSTLVFEKAVKLMVEEVGIDLPSVSRMASLTPAHSLGIDHLTGSIETGKAADLVVLDKEFNVWMTIHRGTVRYTTIAERPVAGKTA